MKGNIKCIIFDLDGTLFDAPYDWEAIKKTLRVPKEKTILSYIASLPTQLKKEKMQLLESFEREATEKGKLKKGVKGLLERLKSKSIKRILATNNAMKNVRYIMEKYKIDFDMVITRESGMTKPGDTAIRYVLENLHLSRTEIVLVGDSDYDVKTATLSGLQLIIVGEKVPHNSFIHVKNIAELTNLLLQS